MNVYVLILLLLGWGVKGCKRKEVLFSLRGGITESTSGWVVTFVFEQELF